MPGTHRWSKRKEGWVLKKKCCRCKKGIGEFRAPEECKEFVLCEKCVSEGFRLRDKQGKVWLIKRISLIIKTVEVFIVPLRKKGEK